MLLFSIYYSAISSKLNYCSIFRKYCDFSIFFMKFYFYSRVSSSQQPTVDPMYFRYNFSSLIISIDGGNSIKHSVSLCWKYKLINSPPKLSQISLDSLSFLFAFFYEGRIFFMMENDLKEVPSSLWSENSCFGQNEKVPSFSNDSAASITIAKLILESKMTTNDPKWWWRHWNYFLFFLSSS